MAQLNMEVADMQDSWYLKHQKRADFVHEFTNPVPTKIDVESILESLTTEQETSFLSSRRTGAHRADEIWLRLQRMASNKVLVRY
jgi:hypothetical protein